METHKSNIQSCLVSPEIKAVCSSKQTLACPLTSAHSPVTLYTTGAKGRLSCASTHQPLPKAHNYCFAQPSGWYHQARLSLDERKMAVGTLLVHWTHCPCAPLILRVYNKAPFTIQLKGLDKTWSGSTPYFYPEASLEVRYQEAESHRAHVFKSRCWAQLLVLVFFFFFFTLSPHYISRGNVHFISLAPVIWQLRL